MRLLLPVILVVLAAADSSSLHIESQQQWSQRVVSGDFATLVHFKSGMCKSCQEFEPEWTKITQVVHGVRFASVDIDRPFGLKLAKNFGVLDEGIPNLRIFGASKPKGVPVFFGEGQASVIVPKINKALKNDSALRMNGEARMYMRVNPKKATKTEL